MFAHSYRGTEADLRNAEQVISTQCLTDIIAPVLCRHLCIHLLPI